MLNRQVSYEQQALTSSESFGGDAMSFTAMLVAAVIRASRPKTLCDYGAGARSLEKALATYDFSTSPIYLPFDPAFPEYGDPQPAELLCCINVLEYLQADCLESVLLKIASLTERYAFFTVQVSTTGAINCDVGSAPPIFQDKGWWLRIIGKYFDIAWREDQACPSQLLIVATATVSDAVVGSNPTDFLVKAPTIHILVPGSHADVESLLRHPLASVRLRSVVLARAAKKLGWKIVIGETFDSRPDVLYVGKIGAHDIDRREAEWLNYISMCADSGAQVVIDYTDHHCGFSSPMSRFYDTAMRVAHVIVTPSQAMSDLIRGRWSGKLGSIPDLCEINPLPLRPLTQGPWSALWFGSASNIQYLTQFLDDEENCRALRQVSVVTNIDGLRLLQNWLTSRRLASNLPTLKFFDWSLSNLETAAAESDIAIIPSDPVDLRKVGVSENRLITALALGLPTVATPLRAYEPYQAVFVSLKTEWPASLKRFSESLGVVRASIFDELGKFTESRLCDRWSTLLQLKARPVNSVTETAGENANSSTLQDRQRITSPGDLLAVAKSGAIKLNLGCGDKILPGYINVDVAASRRHQTPDLLCDVRNLSPIPSDYADEVLAVHVIEHFYQWEVDSILREWIRVLKPGGRLVLECPNLENAAREFLENADQAALGGVEGQRSMWVFYGDPSWCDPLMIHRWGYTPSSLKFVLSKAGLINVRRERAMYKLGEPRDMRIVGLKSITSRSSQAEDEALANYGRQ
jgi:SAM-dependent methyltransferase